MACDTCGKTGVHLVDLRDEYRTPKISAVCDECEKIINRQNTELLVHFRKVRVSILNRFIDNLRRSKRGSCPPELYKRANEFCVVGAEEALRNVLDEAFERGRASK